VSHSDDICIWLRRYANIERMVRELEDSQHPTKGMPKKLNEAADEIERLRTVVRRLEIEVREQKSVVIETLRSIEQKIKPHIRRDSPG
jgi:archaellum component FlaC